MVRETEPRCPRSCCGVVDLAAAAFPGDAEWARTRAHLALRAERDGRPATAVRAWAGVSSARSRVTRAVARVVPARVRGAVHTRGAGAGVRQVRPRASLRHRHAADRDRGLGRCRATAAWTRPLHAAPRPRRDRRGPAPRGRPRAAGRETPQGAGPARPAGRVRAIRPRTTGGRWRPCSPPSTTAWPCVGCSPVIPPRRSRAASALIAVAMAAGDDALLADLVPSLLAGLPDVRDRRAADCRRAAGTRPARRRRALAGAAGSVGRPRRRRGESCWPARCRHVAPGRRSSACSREWSLPATTPGRARRRGCSRGRGTHRHGPRRPGAWPRASARPSHDTPDAQAGWAAMALAAGDRAAAARLADAAMGSAREIDARAVKASLASSRRPSGARCCAGSGPCGARSPIPDTSSCCSTPSTRSTGRRPRDARPMPTPTLVADRRHAARATGDLGGGAGRCRWCHSRRGARPRARPGAADRLDVSLALAAGDGEAAWASCRGQGSRGGPERAGRLGRACASMPRSRRGGGPRPPRCSRDLEARLTDGERTLATARLRLGRDGVLDETGRTALQDLVAAGRYARPVDRAAGDRRREAARVRRRPRSAWPAVARRRSSAALPLPADVRRVAAEALLGLGRAADVLRLDRRSRPRSRPDCRWCGLARSWRSDTWRRGAPAWRPRPGHRTSRRVSGVGRALDSPDARVRVLGEALARQPDDRQLRLRHADALRLAGDLGAARAEAEALLLAWPGLA